MNILIAPNAFKNSLDAQSAAEAIAAGLQQSGLDCIFRLFPVGDGGDGTGDLLIDHLQGRRVTVPVHDALGREIDASFGLVDEGQTAIVEMANASGIRLLKTDELNPLQASTYGTGELIKAALDHGASKMIIGMGGSATVDGGAGILNALGIRFLNADGEFLKAVPEALTDLATIDTSGLDERIAHCDITVLCDVDNKLLGADGAAAVFGPQKGASAQDVAMLDTMLARFAALALQTTSKDMAGIKHGGTAGGAAAGMYAFLNAKLVSGADHFLNLSGFDIALNNTDLVITGEGSIDEQSLQGKAPTVVTVRAKQKNIKVIGLAGKIPQTPGAKLNQLFDELISINKHPIDLQTALLQTRQNLQSTAFEIGNRLPKR